METGRAVVAVHAQGCVHVSVHVRVRADDRPADDRAVVHAQWPRVHVFVHVRVRADDRPADYRAVERALDQAAKTTPTTDHPDAVPAADCVRAVRLNAVAHLRLLRGVALLSLPFLLSSCSLFQALPLTGGRVVVLAATPARHGPADPHPGGKRPTAAGKTRQDKRVVLLQLPLTPPFSTSARSRVLLMGWCHRCCYLRCCYRCCAAVDADGRRDRSHPLASALA
jgi:hypothetical protein